MQKDIDLETIRHLLKSSKEREGHIRDFVDKQWVLAEKHKHDILKFSKFLIVKKVAKWSEVSPSIARSFIILNQGVHLKDFDSKKWASSMKIFFDFLIGKNIVQKNPFLKNDIFQAHNTEDRLTPIRVCLQCGTSISGKNARLSRQKFCKKCSSLNTYYKRNREERLSYQKKYGKKYCPKKKRKEK